MFPPQTNSPLRVLRGRRPSPAAVLLIAAALGLPLLGGGCAREPAQRQDQLLALARWEDRRLAPEDSLLALMGGSDAHLRLAAVRAAGLIGRDFAVDALIKALDDPSVRIRRQACFSLGLLGSPRGADALAAAALDPRGKIRLAALQGLALAPNDGQALLQAAVDSLPQEAAAAWDALRNQAERVDRAALVAAIAQALKGQPPAVQWRVLRCAEVVPDSAVTPLALPFVKARDVQVRVHAYRALARQGTRRALDGVLAGVKDHRRFRGSARERVDLALCRALGRLGPLAMGADDPAAQEAADRAAALLVAAADAQSAALASVALQAMGECAAGRPLPPQAEQMESLLPPWRITLARAARARLADGRVAVREAACTAWSALRGGACAPDLQTVLERESDPRVLAAAVTASAQEHPQPWPILIAYAGLDPLQSPPAAARPALRNGMVRQAALEGMVLVLKERSAAAGPAAAADSPAAASAAQVVERTLLAGLRDQDFVVAATAAGLLGAVPGPVALQALLQAWPQAAGPGRADLCRGILTGLTEVLAGMPAAGPATLAVPTGGDAPAARDSLRERAAQVLQESFADPDLRIRLAGRQAALASGLLPAALIPAEGSLRATLPAAPRDPAQPPLALPFAAPSLRCVSDRGSFTIRLDGRIAPNTCAAIVDLVERGFYTDLVWHRVVPDFVVQGGDPLGNGWGGPGYSLRCEYSPEPFVRGVVGIAHDGKDTGGSQIFITLSEQPHLNGRYTVVGRVVKGMAVVDRLQAGDRFSVTIADRGD